MANKISTVRTYPLNGAVDFTITFEYLARKFVRVTLIGKDRKELVLNQDYRFTTKTQITTSRAWTAADGYHMIEIRRFTSASDRLVDFADGSILRAYDLNISQIQTLHVAEEARDLTADTIGVNNDGHLDARGRRIVNLAHAVDDGDAVSLGQLKTMDKNSWQARNEALQFRNEAETFRNQAEGFKNESGTNATKTNQWRNEAEGFRDEAEQFKDTSGQYADAAGSAAGNAKDSEDEARRIAASIREAGMFGYITRRSFEKGFNVTTWYEVLLWEDDGAYYRWDGTLPKNVPAGSTPESSGGVGSGAWLSVGDGSLRSDLSSTDVGKGSSLIGTTDGSNVQEALDDINNSIYQDPLTNWPLGGTLKIKQGVYNVTSPLVLDYGNYDARLPGSPGVRAHYEGENMAETIFNCQGTDFTLKMLGDTVGGSQRGHAYDYLGNITLKGSTTSYGLLVTKKAYTKLENIVSYGHDNGEGLRTDSVLTSELSNVYLQSNRIGWRVLNSDGGSELNAITVNRLTASQNTQWGILGERWGAGTTINSLTCEGNGTHGDSGTGGMLINVNGLNGSCALVLNNPYFEANAGGSDISINNTGTRPVTVVINGGNFNRVSSTAYTTYNILASSTGGGKLTVILNGTTFQSAGGYVPDVSRPYWRGLGNVEFIDIGCTFMEETSKAISVSSGSIPRSGRINANGSAGVAPGVSSVNVAGTGIYDVNFSNPLAVAADCYVVQITPISAPDSVSCDVIYFSTTSFRVILRNTISGAGIASDFAFSITRLI